MSIYIENLNFLNSCAYYDLLGYVDDKLIKDERYLTNYRTEYNFNDICYLLNKCFNNQLILYDLNYDHKYYNNILNGLDGIQIFINGTQYTNEKKKQLSNLHDSILTRLNNIKRTKQNNIIKSIKNSKLVLDIETNKKDINNIIINIPEIEPNQTEINDKPKSEYKIKKYLKNIYNWFKTKINRVSNYFKNLFK